MKKTLSVLLSVVMTFTLFCSSITVEAVEPESETPAVENDISVSGTNSFGQLMSEALAEEADRQEINSGFNVFSAEVTDNIVTVKYEALENCTMLAAVYDESGENMIASGKTEAIPKKRVMSEEEDDTLEGKYAEITIKTDSMPQYFYLRVFLVDSETLSPLCTAYESPNYTQEMQEFFAKTTGDFDTERVLDLDGDSTNNFAVLNEKVKIIESDGTVNNFTTADIETQYYVIENADSSVTSLETGDIFTYGSGTEQLIVKVGTISLSDDSTVTITGGDTSTEEVFEYIKIDTSKESPVPEPQALPMPFEPQNKKTDGEVSASAALNVDFEKDLNKINDDNGVKLKGSLSFKVTGTIKFYLTGSYKYFEFRLDYSAAVEASVEAEFKKTIPLGKSVEFTLIAGIKVKITPSFIVQLEASVKISGTLEGTVGFSMGTREKAKSLTESPSFKPKVEAEGTFFIGFSLEPAVDLSVATIQLAELSLEAVLGAEITASSAFPQDDPETHLCSGCLDGDISAKIEVSIEAALGDPDRRQQSATTTAAVSQPAATTRTTAVSSGGNSTPSRTTAPRIRPSIIFDKANFSAKIEITPIKIKLWDFYYSADYGFGWGKCPYDLNKISFKVLSKDDGKPLSGAVVEWGDKKASSNSDGIAELVLDKGDYTVLINCDGYRRKTERFTVYEQDRDITVYLEKQETTTTTTSTTTTATTTKTTKVTAISTTMISDIRYSIYDDHVVVSGHADRLGYIGSSDVILLSEVKGLPVTEIGDNAFKQSEFHTFKLTSITIPNSITRIGERAFYQCDDLKSVMLSDGIISIGEYAFYSCNNLTSVTIPDSVTSIGKYAFGICTNLTSITIPGNVTNIGKGAFSSCTSLTSATISNGITSIVDEMFQRCDNLTSVTIPDSVTSIGHAAFSYCDSLTSITIPDSVTSIGEYAFEHCKSLISIVIPNGVTSIGYNMFYYCYNLTSITIPDSVTSIEKSAFDLCRNLIDVYYYTETVDVYYTGTEEQWNAIDIGLYNEDFKNATIHYNYNSGSSAKAYSLQLESPEILADEPTAPDLDNLIPNAVYNFYAFNDKQAEDLLSSENLLYVIQFTTDENGRADIPYTPTDDQYLIAGAVNNIADADINIGEVVYTGFEMEVDPVVTWYGTELTEGVDYEIYGSLFATEIGTYKILIKGIGSFTGETAARYNIVCGHDFSDGICTICGEKEAADIPVTTTAGTTVTTTTTTTAAATTTVTSDISSLKNGTCGENAVWYFDEKTGLLTVSGAGEMTDFGNTANIPWYEFRDNIKSVDIESGITSIGSRAFMRCEYLTSITIPDTVTYIGNRAFVYCSRLSSIKLPDNITSVEDFTFFTCVSLESLVIPYSVISIGECAFCDSDLKSVTILNPECKIYDSEDTIFSGAVIYGCKNSTAQEYAEKYERTFVEITAPEVVLGDINGDGMVDASDASSVLAEYANLSTGGSGTFSDNQKSAGDVNSDGMIDANDASAILAFYSYLSTDGTEKDMRVWLGM